MSVAERDRLIPPIRSVAERVEERVQHPPINGVADCVKPFVDGSNHRFRIHCFNYLQHRRYTIDVCQAANVVSVRVTHSVRGSEMVDAYCVLTFLTRDVAAPEPLVHPCGVLAVVGRGGVYQLGATVWAVELHR